jgi:hypothetical protein
MFIDLVGKGLFPRRRSKELFNVKVLGKGIGEREK